MSAPRSPGNRHFWGRANDRSLHLIVIALTLWLATFIGYRIATAVAVADPLAELAVRGTALLAVMPSDHSARVDLADIVHQAEVLAAQHGQAAKPEQPPAVKAAPAASPAAEAAEKPETKAAAKPGAKPGEKPLPPEVELATRTLRVLDQLQDGVDNARIRLDEATRAEHAPPAPPDTTATDHATDPTPPVPTPAEAAKSLDAAAALLPAARPLRSLALWLANIPRYERERNFWAAFWAITAAAAPAAVSFWYVLRGRQLPLTFPADHHLPAAARRRREQDRDLRQSTLAAYFLHALMIILPMLGFAHAYNLGPPGGGGGAVGSEAKPQEQIKIIQVKQRKLMVNPFSAIRINQPKELELDLAEETRQMATAKVAGGSGDGDGGGYGAGVKGGAIRFVVVNHGGHGWDEANAVAAPNFLREFGRRVAVPTDRLPISVRISDLAAQRDPRQQPPLLYLCGDETGFVFSAEDLAFLRRYTLDIGGMLLIDDTGGALGHTQALASRLFPGQPLVAIPNDDPLFRGRQPLGEEDRALAKHDGDRILGVRNGNRWVLVFHPGDLVDGWRGAYGVRWQEIAYRFGINVWDYAAIQFDRVRTAHDKK